MGRDTHTPTTTDPSWASTKPSAAAAAAVTAAVARGTANDLNLPNER